MSPIAEANARDFLEKIRRTGGVEVALDHALSSEGYDLPGDMAPAWERLKERYAEFNSFVDEWLGERYAEFVSSVLDEWRDRYDPDGLTLS